MKKQTRFFLLTVLILTMLVLTATFAAAKTIEVSSGSLASAVATASAGDTINITGNLTDQSEVTISKDLTITGSGSVEFSGAGFNITAGNVNFDGITIAVADHENSESNVIKYSGTANVTIHSGTYKGTIQTAGSNGSSPALTINNGTFEGGKAFGLRANNDGIMTVNGGTFTAPATAILIYVSDSGMKFYLHGGDFTAIGSSVLFDFRNSSILEIGKPDGTVGPTLIHTGSGNIMTNGGDHTTDTPRNIYAGTFDAQGSGYVLDLNKDAPYLIDIKGGTFTAAGNDVIRVNDGNVKNFVISGGTFIAHRDAAAIEKNNGKLTITGGHFMHDGSGHIIECVAEKTNGTLTITGGSGLTMTHTGTGNIIRHDANYDVVLTNVTANHEGTGYGIYITTSGNISMDQCVITSASVAVYVSDSALAKLTMRNNVFTSTENAAFYMGGATVSANDNTFVDAEGFSSPSLEWQASNFMIGDMSYATLEDAIAAVKNGQVITVLTDFSAKANASSSATYTIDLQGKTWRGSLIVSSGHVTVKNATFNGMNETPITVNNVNASLRVENCTIYYGSKNSGIVLDTGDTANGKDIYDLRAFANVVVINTDIINVFSFVNGAPMKDENGEIIISTSGESAVRATGGRGRIDVLSGKLLGGQSWIQIRNQSVINVGDPSLPSNALYCREAVNRAVWLANASFGGEINIYNGDFSLSADDSASYYFNCAGATLNVMGGVFDGSIDIFSMHDDDLVSPVNISGGIFNMTGSASVIEFSAKPSVDYPEWNTADKAGHVHISGGVFNTDPNCNGDLISLTNTKPGGTVRITGGEFHGGKTRIIFAQNSRSPVSIEGGTFDAAGIRLFYINGSNYFTISGGTFILQPLAEGSTANSKDCVIHMVSNAKSYVNIVGGTFINNRPGCKNVLLLENDLMSFHINGGTFYTVEENGHFLFDAHDELYRNIAVNRNNKADYEGTSYYVLTTKAATSVYAPAAALTPVFRSGLIDKGEEGWSVDVASQGIRFSAYLPAHLVTSLKAMGELSYGTLIMPYDTFKTLTSTEYHKGTGFVDVVASNGLSKGTDGSITFHASLINIKEQNSTKKFIGIPYVKITAADGSVSYHYAGVNETGARSLADVVKTAVKDVSAAPQSIGSKVYAYYSVYDNGEKYSRYSKDEQYTFEKHLYQ